MSTTVSLNGVSYAIPATGENSWGDAVSSYLIALGSGVLQKAGGSFTLTAEVDFGATYGLKSTYYKSRATSPASAGTLRLGNSEYVKWRNAGDSADLGLRVNSSDVLEFNSLPISAIALGTANQVLGMNSGATAQEYKTVTGTSNQVTVTHGANSITLSTPQSIGTGSSPTFAGLTLSGVTASKALTTNGSSAITASATTATELGYLSGVTTPTGSGALVLATSPTLVTPTLGVATATTINKVTLTAPATGSTLTIADGKTLTLSNTLTFTGTDSSSVAFGAGGTVIYSGGSPSFAAVTVTGLTASRAMVTDGSKGLASSAVTSTELGYLSGVTTPTGSGALVLATSPTLVTPTIGVATATSVNKVTITAPASSATLTIANGKTLTLSNTLTFTGTDSSSVAFGAGGTVVYTSNDLSVFASTTSLQLKTLISDETGSGALVFGTSPSLASPTFSDYTLFTESSAPSTPASGKVAIYTKTDKKVYKKTSDGVEAEIGAGSGGSINYVSNADFEGNAVTGYATYADAAATTPVDGTGGSPNSTFAATSSSPLRGTYSGLFTKGAANRQGEGFSYDFSIATADKSRPLAISWEGSASANYTGSSGSEYMSVFIYDVTNSTLIYPISTSVAQGNTKGYTTFLATTSTSYRLIFHVAGTGTSAWTYLIDSVSVSPQLVVQGAAINDFISFTPTWTNGGTASTVTASYRRIGSSIHIIVNQKWTAAGSAATMSFTLPNSLAFDTNYVKTGGAETAEQIGHAQWWDDSVSKVFDLSIYPSSSTAVTFRQVEQTSDFQGSSLANLDYTNFHIIAPISTWSSNVQMADRAVEEYAFNTATADSDDTTSFGYGSTGQQFGSFTATRSKTVQFTTAIQPTDKIFVEVTNDGGTTWIDAAIGTASIFPPTTQNANDYGVKWTSSSSTKIVVTFGGYRANSGATFGSAGAAWSSIAASATHKWRVRKVSGGASVGYPVSSANVVGRTDGNAPASGYVGQKLAFTSRAVTTSTGAWAVNSSALTTLTNGTWLVCCYGAWAGVNTASFIGFACGTSTTPGSGFLGDGQHAGYVNNQNASASNGAQVPGVIQYHTVSSDTPIYGHAYTEDSNPSVTVAGFAIRIA